MPLEWIQNLAAVPLSIHEQVCIPKRTIAAVDSVMIVTVHCEHLLRNVDDQHG